MTITPEAYKEYLEEIWGEVIDWKNISTPALREFLRGGDTLE